MSSSNNDKEAREAMRRRRQYKGFQRQQPEEAMPHDIAVLPPSLLTLDFQEMRDEANRLNFNELLERSHQIQRSIDQIDAAGAILIGTLLLAAQEKCPHGSFLGWLEQNTENISRATAYRYMDLAKHWEELELSHKFLTVRNFSLQDAYAEIQSHKRQLKQVGESPVTIAPRRFFQEPKRLKKLANSLEEAIAEAEPFGHEEEALLKQIQEAVTQLRQLADRG
ncbi:DUF3102 domain-containing protein (plasmid) [Synechococcus elongatus PCC 11801]|uniref:DUF3102 domain-containing protein n=1 Tax=Synechococcus elongatus PCC 11801 TaxID=2219813 RepID=A0ACD5A2Z0_SYNEL